MTGTEDKMVVVLLNAINDRLARIERWTENHDGSHRARAEARAEEMVEYEKRLTKIETEQGATSNGFKAQLNIRSAIAFVVAAIWTAFEVLRQMGQIR